MFEKISKRRNELIVGIAIFVLALIGSGVYFTKKMSLNPISNVSSETPVSKVHINNTIETNKIPEIKKDDFQPKEDFKKASVNYDKTVLDNYAKSIGCGDFSLINELAGNMKNYLYFAMDSGENCNAGNKTQPRAIFEIDKNGKTSQIYEHQSGGELISLSPKSDKMLILGGNSNGGGSCWSGYYFEILDLNKKKIVATNEDFIINSNSDYYFIDAANLTASETDTKWLDNNTLEYKEGKILRTKCENHWEEEDKITEIKILKVV